MAPDVTDVMDAIQDFKREMQSEIWTVNQSIQHCSDTADEFKSALDELKALTSRVKSAKEDCLFEKGKYDPNG